LLTDGVEKYPNVRPGKEYQKTDNDSAITVDTNSGVVPFVYQADTNAASPSSLSLLPWISMLPAILDFLHIISAIRCMPDIARDFRP
jgi:hypothetical protein